MTKKLLQFILLCGIIVLTGCSLQQNFGATVLQIFQGGTGTSTKPTNNKMLIADINGNWEYTATSSLGISQDLSGYVEKAGSITQITTRDHDLLTGLTDDDHIQYALLAGRSGGQTLIGGTASGNNLTLQSTSNATKGKILFGTSAYDEVNNRLGIGTASPLSPLHLLDDKAIGLGNVPDVLIDYDSGNNSLDIDLATNGVNTGLRILTDGNANVFIVDGVNGRIGIGTNAPEATLDVRRTLSSGGYILYSKLTSTALSGNSRTILSDISANLTSASTGSYWGLNAKTGISSTANITGTIGGGLYTGVIYPDVGVVFSKVVGVRGAVTDDLGYTGTVTNAISVDSGGVSTVGTTITNAYNFYGANHIVIGGSIGTGYGLYLEEQTVATNNYEMWLAGSGEIFFRDTAIHLGSLTDGHLDLTADISVDVNAPVLVLPVKTDTGDPAGQEGAIYINTFDNVLRYYADGLWRTAASY